EIKNTKGPVLEAGVGTGRIFVPALKGSADIYGIDYSEQMLCRLKEKINEKEHHRISKQDIRSFKLDKKFDLVISPFRVFQHFLSIEDQLNALNCIYEHLNPGGRLIFDVFNPDLKRITQDADNVLEFDGEYEPGKKLKRFSSVRYDNINQILGITFKFVWDENGEEKEDEFYTLLRYYFLYELENLIGRTKFRLDNIYGGFDRSKLNNDSKEFIVVCRK
ncbi:MAG TPA: class I SAM-dependent methyltransferase, partial [Ignavibacteria bacterium]